MAKNEGTKVIEQETRTLNRIVLVHDNGQRREDRVCSVGVSPQGTEDLDSVQVTVEKLKGVSSRGE